jgi:predicted MFS family arabinose efflux permease
MASSGVVLYAISALAPFMVAELDLSRAAVGALVTVSFAVAAVTSLVAGRLVDVVGARVGLAVLAVVVALGLVIASASDTYAWLLAGIALAGVGQALANPATNVLIASTVPLARRGAAVGMKQSGVQVASFGAGLLLPFVAAGSGWRVALRWTSLLPVLLLVAVWWLLPATTGERRDAGGWWRWSAPSRWLAWLTGYSLLLGTGLSAVNTYLPLYAAQRLGFADWRAGVLLAAFGATGLVARVMWGRWADLLPDVTVSLVWLSAASVGGVLLVSLATPGWSALVWLGAVVIGGSATAANAVSMVAVVRRGGATGQASGLASLGFFSGFVIGPTMFGAIADGVGYQVSWSVVGVVFAGSALVGLGVRAVGRVTAGCAPGSAAGPAGPAARAS